MDKLEGQVLQHQFADVTQNSDTSTNSSLDYVVHLLMSSHSILSFSDSSRLC